MSSVLTKAGLRTQLAFKFNQVSSTCIAVFESELHRDRAESKLAELGIETRRWWGDGLHRMPFFSGFRSTQSLQNTEEVASTTLGIPFYRDLEPEAIERIGFCI